MLLACLFLPLEASHGQTHWSVEGGGPTFGEYNAPDVTCLPFPPPYFVFPAPAPPAGCPAMGPFSPGDCRVGGSAFDDDGNLYTGGTAFPAMLHADGKVVVMADPATGAYILSMRVGGTVLPGAVSGLGYDSRNDICWVTDGVFCAGVGLVSCGVPPVLVGPFALPLVAGSTASGLDWDPCTGTLWFSDCAGNVTNCDTFGNFIASFPAVLPGGGGLTGLDVNVTNGNILVTDGITVAEFTPAGVPAAPGAFYLKANPYVIPLWAGPVNGLAFSLRPQRYGKGCSSDPTSPPPKIGYSGGYPFAGNGGFNVFETGATPGAQAFFIYGFQEACPPIPFGGCPGAGIWIFPIFGPFSLGVVPASGTVNLPVNIPPSNGSCGFPVGITLRIQFINVISFVPLKLEHSDALSFTIGER